MESNSVLEAVKVRIPRVEEAWRQYVDGAITYVEFVRLVGSLVTQADVEEHNAYVTKKGMAEWPFAG